MIGTRFGKRTIIDHGPKNKWGGKTVILKCDCGNTSIVAISKLRFGKSPQCYDCSHKIILKPGEVFGNRTVVEESDRISKSGARKYKCICQCGEISNINASQLIKNINKSCRKCMFPKLNVGDKFGWRTVIDEGKRYGNMIKYKCLCKCGNESLVPYTILKVGRGNCCFRCRWKKASAEKSE